MIATTQRLNCARILASLQRPGAKHTSPKRQTSPKVRFFHVPEFTVLDVGRPYPQGRAQRFGVVFKSHIHSAALNSQRMVFVSPEGAKAMNKVTTSTTSTTDTLDYLDIACMLEDSRHSETLGIMRDQPVTRTNAELSALFAGARALKYAAQDFAIKVRDAGLLLCAFDGTTVLKNGGAA